MLLEHDGGTVLSDEALDLSKDGDSHKQLNQY